MPSSFAGNLSFLCLMGSGSVRRMIITTQPLEELMILESMLLLSADEVKKLYGDGNGILIRNH